MQKTRTLLTWILICVLTVTMMSGCGAADVSEKQQSDNVSAAVNDFTEHMDISIAFWDVETALTSNPDDKVLKTIEDKFNVTFVPQNMTWDDESQKLELWSAAGTLPDVFASGGRNSSVFARRANEGVIKEIPSDLSAFPNLERYMKDSPVLPTCMVDGKIYCIFRQTHREQASTATDRMVAYRWDLAQKAGITKEPENWDEFREMIQAIIKADPENKGIQGLTSFRYDIMFEQFIPYVSVLYPDYWVDNGDGTYVPVYFSGEERGENMLPLLHLLRDMYQEGTIEKDIALQNMTQAEEKFLKGENAAILFDGTTTNHMYDGVSKYWKEIYGNDFLEDCRYLNLMDDQNGKKAYIVEDYAWSETYINNNVSDAKMNRILAIYDYLLSEEGAILSNCGIEGESYGYDENGNITYTGYGNGIPADTFPSILLFRDLVTWCEGGEFYDKFPAKCPQEYVDANNNLKEQARKVEIPEYDLTYSSVFIEKYPDFTLKKNDDFLRVMTGTESVEKMWADIIAGYEEQGLEEVISGVNEIVKNK